MTMPAGEYYIGDLCYVIEEWSDYCDIVIKDNVLDGEFFMPDGRKFASYSTKYGDGVYYDQFGASYPVDAGVIGCILVSDISKKYPDRKIDKDLGNFYNFKEPFETGSEDGVITFGHIVIDTEFSDYDEYDFEEDYDE